VKTHNPAVLFLCVHNAGRSQMAAAMLRLAAGERIAVYSAGSDPAETLNPAVVVAMAEIGIDITDRVPTRMTDDLVQEVDVVVTMGCGDACPVYPGKRYLDWELPDPAGQPLDAVRTIRDDIATRVDRLLDELLSEPA
jgi:arsenate reductase